MSKTQPPSVKKEHLRAAKIDGWQIGMEAGMAVEMSLERAKAIIDGSDGFDDLPSPFYHQSSDLLYYTFVEDDDIYDPLHILSVRTTLALAWDKAAYEAFRCALIMRAHSRMSQE